MHTLLCALNFIQLKQKQINARIVTDFPICFTAFSDCIHCKIVFIVSISEEILRRATII